jgi:hypothetical protein
MYSFKDIMDHRLSSLLSLFLLLVHGPVLLCISHHPLNLLLLSRPCPFLFIRLRSYIHILQGHHKSQSSFKLRYTSRNKGFYPVLESAFAPDLARTCAKGVISTGSCGLHVQGALVLVRAGPFAPVRNTNRCKRSLGRLRTTNRC